MEEMIVKNVNVMGDFITAAKDHGGNVWVGVRWVRDALGMTEGQMKRQIKNIKKDMVFGEGGSNQIPLPTAQGTQEVFCIRNDFVLLWLAKINITQKTREERPDFAEKLLEYQLKAKDILAAAFLPEQSISDPDLRISGGTTIRLYKNNQWGILDMGGNLYNLTPDEFSMVAKLIPALDKNGVKQVPLVITTLLGISGRSGKLKYVGTYTCQDNKQ